MKAIKLFAIAAITLGMMACNKKDDNNVTPNEGAQATLSIKVDASSGLRAIGSPSADGDVKSLEVYVYNGEYLEGYKKAENAVEVVGIPVTTGARKLVVVSNANIGSVSTLTELQDKVVTGKLPMISPAGESQVGIMMTSEVKDITIKAGKNTYGFGAVEGSIENEPLDLLKVPARISLVGASTAFEGTYAGWTFEPDQVFLFNVPSATRVFPSGGNLVVPDAPYFAGVDKKDSWSGSLWAGDQTKRIELADAVTDLSTITADNPAYYYSYENDAKVVLVIKGKLKDAADQPVAGAPYADAEGFTYYSILINDTREGYSYRGDNTGIGKLKRNTDYQLSVTIKRPGTADPTTPPAEAATLDVKVTVKPWMTVNQNVEY